MKKTISKLQKNQAPNGGFANLMHTLMLLLMVFNPLIHTQAKRAGTGTQETRAAKLKAIFRVLYFELGLKITDVHAFKRKHMKALTKYWLDKGYAPATIANYFSIMRLFCDWIGKPGMIGDLSDYYDDPNIYKVHSAARKSKAWSDNGVKPDDKILEVLRICPIVALQLLLQIIFGLRLTEAMLLKVHLADQGDVLLVSWGTKGGRPRSIPIDTEEKRLVLDLVKSYVKQKGHSLIPREYKLKQWKSRYYRVVRACGITRKDGITSHGLRHEYANAKYELIAKVAAPLRRKSGDAKPTSEVDRMARMQVSEELGHSRISVTSAYLGSSRNLPMLRGVP